MLNKTTKNSTHTIVHFIVGILHKFIKKALKCKLKFGCNGN